MGHDPARRIGRIQPVFSALRRFHARSPRVSGRLRGAPGGLFAWRLLFLGMLCLAPATAVATVHAVTDDPPAKPSVLLLNSYHNGYSWSDNIITGLRESLAAAGETVDLHIEYLDGKRTDSPAVRRELAELLAAKLEETRLAVLITSDNLAFEFARERQQTLFQGVPIVFCGVNGLDPEEIAGQAITGVLENVDVASTLRVAKRLHPWARKVVVLGDASVTGLAIRSQVEEAARQLGPLLDFEYHSTNSLPAILDVVSAAPQDVLFYYIPSYFKVRGALYDAEESLEAIEAATARPIYSNWLFLLRHGAVGGRLAQGYDQGWVAGELTTSILRGAAAASLPVRADIDHPYIFHHAKLEQLGVDRSQLPPDSAIVDAPRAFYEVSKELLWTILVFLAVLAIALALLAVNILRRRRIERTITNQLTFQKILIDSIPQLVCWKDSEGRYLGANQAFTKFFGIESPAAVIGKKDHHFMKEGRFTEWTAAVTREVLRQDRPRLRMRISLTGPGSEPVWLEMNMAPIHTAQGRVVGTLALAENVTREINLERQLLQSQKMEAIGALAGGVAHDFNNILTSIVNSTELALLDIEADTETARDLERVLKAATRGKRLIQQIMAFSRPSQEGFQPTDLAELVQDTVNLLRPSLPRNITIRAHVDAPHSRVLVDPTQLYQCLMNLCTNAFQAMRETGGALDVKLQALTLSQEHAAELNMEPGPAFRLVVADSGPGVPPHIIDKIFDPFFTTKGKKEGTGLGLAMVLGIVKNHGGAVRVESQPGEGAVFELSIPARLVEEPEQAAMPPAPQWPGRGRALFVEDDPEQLATTPRVLESLGYETVAAEGAEAAMRVLEKDAAFDVVITDFDMPGQNGVELAKLVDKLLPRVPVIIISGRHQAKESAKHAANVVRVVEKPFGREELADAVGLALRHAAPDHAFDDDPAAGSAPHGS